MQLPQPPQQNQQAQDPVSQMQSFLKTTGYQAPTSTPSGAGGDWYSSVIKATPSSASTPTTDRNGLQSTLGAFFDPLLQEAGRTGQAIGEAGVKGVNKLTGGALDKYAKGGSVDKAIADYNSKPDTIPGLNTPLPAVNDDNPENTTGRALGTVGLGMAGVGTAGAVLGVGNAMQQNKGAGEVAIDGVVNALAGKILEHGFTAIAPYVEKAAMKFGAPVLDKLAQFIPESSKSFISNLTSKIPDITDAKVLPDAVSGAINKANEALPNYIDKPLDAVAGGVKKVVGSAGQGASDVLDSLQTKLSKGNVSENLDTSVERIAAKNASDQANLASAPKTGVGTNPPVQKDPLATYDDFYNQEQKFKKDAHEDTALGVVGERTGDAYDKVIGMRQAAGKAMETEMGKVGNIKTDISESFTPLEEELQKNGATFDASKGKLKLSKTSKLTSQDKGMVENYVQNLNKLGANPTAAELDAFLSRVPNELDIYKGKNNITKVTNGERIIKGSLTDLRKSLTAKANPQFANYEKAKSDYSSLTKFLDEGSSFLGKKTQSGDYAKDASLAKSSIQSALNGGKKDWLIKLEGLTGYPAIDESMLALQAMKDAGNFRGSSLLDLLSPENKTKIPTTKEGIVGKAIDYGVTKGKQALVGTPNEQTRRIIQERMAKGVPTSGSFTP